jgi:ABC-type molybdate transport system substrate-binding protein
MLINDLVSHFKLPSDGFVQETLVGWLGVEPWTQKHGNSITINGDGSIKVMGKIYANDTSLDDFLTAMHKNFDTLYDDDMKEAVSKLHTLANEITVLASRVKDNGWSKHHSNMLKTVVEAQAESVRSAAKTLNSLANNMSSYNR